MPIKTTNQGGEFELAPQGVHVARCCKIIDLGTHEDAKFKKKRRLAWIFWELPNTQDKNGDPFLVGNRYTLSHNEKATLRAHLESWYGRQFDDAALDKAGGFDLERLLGRTAMLNIVHSQDGKYANVKAVMPLLAGTMCPPPQMETVVFSFDPYNPAIFASLSNGMQEFIRGSEEWQFIVNGHPPAGAAGGGNGTGPAGPAAPDDDVPFGPAPTPQQRPAGPAQRSGGKFDDMEDDIPFLFNESVFNATIPESRSCMRANRARKGMFQMWRDKAAF